MEKIFKYIVGVFAVVLLGSGITLAQVTGGAVTGSVVDANGAVVPNAAVKLVEKARGVEFTATTTGAGSYQFPNVPVGEYTIIIEASGFGKITRDVVVSLNQTTTVDASLQPGSTTTVVDVVGTNEAVVQSDTSQLGRSFDQRKIQDLPINGNPNNLAVLAPNVIPPANGTAGSGGVSGGVRARGNSFNVDGVDNNDASVTGPSTGVIQDAVQEFTLLQNNFSAEFGAGAGGQFNTITQTGTNQFRGRIFSYIGSQKFNARSTDEDGTDKNFNKDVRYGGTFGGPMPFFNFGEGGPMFISGKNKLFFFGAYEKYYQTGASSAGFYYAPTLQGINQLAAAPGVSPYVIDIFRNYVSLAPTADARSTERFGNILGLTGVPFGVVTLPIPASQQQKSYQFNVDHLPNQSNQFRYRYNRTRYSAEGAGNGGLAFNNLTAYNTDLLSFNYIKTFGSSLVNDLRLSYLRTVSDYPLKNQALNNFPNLTVNSLNLSIGPSSNLPQSGYDNNYQLYDSMTLIKGQHTFKFGGDVRRYIGGSDFLPRSRGDYYYSTFDVLLRDARPDVTNIKGIGSGAFVSNNHRFFVFGQDDWKITPSLTLNLGVRYEYQGLYRDIALQETASPANIPGVVEFGVPKVDKNNFAPRIGFAWSPNWDNFVGRFLFGGEGTSAIRGSFARAYFSNFSNLALISLPPTLQGELQGAGNATNFLQTGGAGDAPFVPNLDPAVLRARAGSLILDQIVPYTDSITFSYQRQIGNSNGLEIRYLRTRSKEMPVQVQLNSRTVVDSAMVIPTFLTTPTATELAALPTIGQVVAQNPTISPTTFLAPRQLGNYGFGGALTGFPSIGESRYDGVAVSLTRRFTNNFGFTAAYTFSKTRDNSTNELFTSLLNPRRAQDAGEYFGDGLDLSTEWADSPLDIPHRFVTSFNVDIPFFNKSENWFLKTILGGFQINGVFQIQSGQPITIQAGRDANRNGDSAGDRAIFNPNGDPTIGSGIQGLTLVNGVVTPVAVGSAPDPNVRAYIATNPNAGFISTGFFAKELANQGAGTVSRNSLRTNGYNNTDLVVLKNHYFGKENRFNFQIGAEIFDLFNQRQRTISGVGATTGAFAIAGNPSFLDYSIGSFSGRSITLRGKFFF